MLAIIAEISVWLLCFIGFGALCLAMPRHRKQLALKVLTDRRETGYRWLGFTLLAVALLPLAWLPMAAADAFLFWVGVLTIAALFYIALLSIQQLRR
ncbi:DUF3325 domain-containing protein [Idiomarina xiamenensis]|uniref:DUF3325 domain-containing protein n=1 Tax=Idiomarina xiamenensis 10-D-4 TaxID=740709 RepID=K2KX60_9GAMM|nr:DUF3325 domain-containing protein [Idiomarina xiamenensis]EKE87079.1 hypothetical protein A10D4_02527 [Idiomarina xiamenensis 10-D-4]